MGGLFQKVNRVEVTPQAFFNGFPSMKLKSNCIIRFLLPVILPYLDDKEMCEIFYHVPVGFLPSFQECCILAQREKKNFDNLYSSVMVLCC